MTFKRGPVDPDTKVTAIPLWNRGDRVRVLRGEHAGRTGTVSVLPSDPVARYLSLEIPNVQVALDGEPGQVAAGPGVRARGGRGGVAIVIHCDDLVADESPPGRAARADGGEPR